ncbi:MAG: GNAT family N-acetyltransferase [Phycisphaeraceae bacterium]|nr:GNAT family N-acetyltransferase [Phycisphaeraceae bacterium]
MLQTSERLAKKIRVRLIEPDDSLAHLTGLLHRAYKQHADRGLHTLAAFQPEEVTRRRIADGECLVATYLGRIVGTIMFKSAEQTARAWPGVPWFSRPEGGVASFSQFAVEPEFQGKGIGAELMAHVEHRTAESGARELALSTPEPAEWLVAMYARHGYRAVSRFVWPNANYQSVIMSKAIGEA